MFKRFQTLISTLTEDMNVCGDVFGFANSDPGDTVVTTDDVKTSMAIAQPNQKSPKKKKRKKGVLYTARRNLANTAL